MKATVLGEWTDQDGDKRPFSSSQCPSEIEDCCRSWKAERGTVSGSVGKVSPDYYLL